MTDILYVLGTGSRWGNREIRYSLRSLCQHGLGFGRVFVIGHDPGFLKDVSTVPLADPTRNKEYNITWMILWACQNTDISDDFVMFNDDHFLTAPAELSAYPLYYKGTLAEGIAKAGSRQYGRSLEATRNRLLALGKPTTSFECHMPIPYNRTMFRGLSELWEESRKLKAGYLARSIYADYYCLPGTFSRDCKLRLCRGAGDVRARIAGRHVFSIHDASIGTGVAKVLGQMFPQKCRFEA